MSFLKAAWRKLIFVNYVVDQEQLLHYVPSGTELDLWRGKCFVSLVGFMFLNTRLLGVKIPFHANFEEVNLRFYVRRLHKGKWRRGVVFIREIVPRWALSFVANHVYHENYETLRMEHSWLVENSHRIVEYRWKKNHRWHLIKAMANMDKLSIDPNSETAFITEHYWGYAKVNDQKSIEYEVTHPIWEHYQVNEYAIDVDFQAVYGKGFSFLQTLQPKSVMLAEGSDITVERKTSFVAN